MKIEHYEIVHPHKCILGECPVWDNVTQSILWIDIERQHIHTYHINSGQLSTKTCDTTIGSIVLDNNGGIMAAVKGGFARMNLGTGVMEMVAAVETELKNNRFNDGKCDPAGRFWAGTMSTDGVKDAGSLYAINDKYAVTKKRPAVSCSNGLAWSGDGCTMFFIDTPTRKVLAFDFDVSTGHISNERVAFCIREAEGFPDGMTIDSDGKLWIALWGGSKIARFEPDSGEKLLEIPLPVPNVTSCTFGGDFLQDLFITTARTMVTSEDALSIDPGGSLFVVKNCGFTGLPAARFGG